MCLHRMTGLAVIAPLVLLAPAMGSLGEKADSQTEHDQTEHDGGTTGDVVPADRQRKLDPDKGGAPAFARPFAGGGLIRVPRSYLIRRPDIRAELKIREEQEAQLSEIAAVEHQAVKDLVAFVQVQSQQLPNLDLKQREEKVAEVRKKSLALQSEIEGKINAVLSDEQRRRLTQIELQLRGIRALSDEGIAEQLHLSLDQQEKIRGVFDSQQQKAQNLMQDVMHGKMDRALLREKQVRLGQETAVAALGVLTDTQKQKLEELKGKKFEFTK